nr:immunoglobulin heavy chain junction region [Mus musculus]MBK4198415.1 immunoglobulin heavy chain junction region [Mus musculus]MBK4198416.1 immunoglobulin heavy chain junction region [Mus musculus]
CVRSRGYDYAKGAMDYW